MAISSYAFSGVCRSRVPQAIDTNPAADRFIRQNFGTTPSILTELFSQNLPLGTDVPIRMVECGNRVEINLACPDPSGTKNIAEAKCYMHRDGEFKFETILLSDAVRGNGIGHKIVRNSLDLAEEMGATTFSVTAGRTNGPSFWAGLNIRPNGNHFDFTFKTPIRDRVIALDHYVSTDTRTGLRTALQMPYPVMPQAFLGFRQNMRFMAEPYFTPTSDLLYGWRGLFDENTPKRALPQIFKQKIAALRRGDGSIPLSSLLMTAISYNAELDMTDNTSIRSVRAAISARLSLHAQKSQPYLPNP